MSMAERIGGAPISWGACEAPDRGHELPPERVLSIACFTEVTR